jgi:NADH:ubiquinone reductase (H+-translocating)
VRVVIVGAGFAGLDCARALAGSPAEVTVVDRNNFHTFLPLLYQVATSGLASADVSYPIRGIFRDADNIGFRRGTVTGVDWQGRRLLLDGGASTLPFDRLILAAGAVASFFGIPGALEHAFPLYDLSDSIRLRNHVLRRFEAVDADPTLIGEGALTFVVVGGGPTGVETAGALSELFATVLRRDFPLLPVAHARVILVEMADEVLGPFSSKARRHAASELVHRGVDLRLGERVASVDAKGVDLASGERVDTHTLIWAAGVQANPLATALGVAQDRGGRITVDERLALPGVAGAYAIGDVAAIRASGGGLLPQLAPVAKQSGTYVGQLLSAEASGRQRPRRAFRYRDKGTMATVGRRSAVADLPLRIRLTGTPAWVAWLGLHLLFLVGFRNRLSVFLNWAWSYFTYDRGPRLIIGQEETAPPAVVPEVDRPAASGDYPPRPAWPPE